MHAVSKITKSSQATKTRAFVHSDEQMFKCVLTDLARMLWPRKTAEHIAAAAHCSVRAAGFYLAGDREWSSEALAAIVAEVLRRHSMRNVKIAARMDQRANGFSRGLSRDRDV